MLLRVTLLALKGDRQKRRHARCAGVYDMDTANLCRADEASRPVQAGMTHCPPNRRPIPSSKTGPLRQLDIVDAVVSVSLPD